MDKRNWLNRFISASLWASSTSYLFFALNFIGQIFLARLLIPGDFGIYAFALALKDIALIFLGFTTNQTFLQSKGKQSDFNASFIIVIFASVLMTLLGIIGGLVLDFIYDWQYAWMMFLVCFAQVFTLLGTVYLAPLEKKLFYKKVAIAQGGSSTVALVVAILAALLGVGLWSLAVRELIQGLALLGLGLYWGEMYFKPKLASTGLTQQFMFGFQTAVSRGLETLYYRFPDIIIQVLLGRVTLGYFYQARYLAYFPIKLTTPFSQQVLFAYLTGIREDREQFRWHLYWINYVISRALLPFALIAFFFGPQIFLLVYGSKWAIAGDYFRYFSLFILFAALFSGVQSACYSQHKQAYVTQAYLIAFIIFVLGIATIFKGQYSALIFSVALMVAYLYLVFRLWFIEVKIPLFKLFLKPVIFVFLTGVIFYMHVSILYFTGILVFATILFYWFERKDLSLLGKRIMQR